MIIIFQCALFRTDKKPGTYDKYDHQNLGRSIVLFLSDCVHGVLLPFFRIRRHVHSIGSKELMDAWNDKGKRLLD